MTDYTEYKKLYLLCFTDDTEEDAEYLFKTVFCKAECVCELNDAGNPIAMLFLMNSDLIINGTPKPYYYLYAACTHPDYRGKGIMGRLLEKAKEVAVKNGKLGIFLKPANPPLFKFYAKSYFWPYFNICKVEDSAESFIQKYNKYEKSVTEQTMSEWHNTRKSFLNNLCNVYADFSKDLFTAATDGCMVSISENAAAVYEVRDNTLIVKEALYNETNVDELFALVSLILQNSSAQRVEIRMPAVLKETLSQYGAEHKAFSVLWVPTPANRPAEQNPYHGFAFD